MTREAENLKRWRASGDPQRWVEARQGRWGHADWLALLDALRQSAYWPMQEAEIGRVLEEARAAKPGPSPVDADPERPISPLLAALLHLLAEGDAGVLSRLRRFLLDPADACAERWQFFRLAERDAWKLVELTLLQRLFERRLKEGELDSWADLTPFGEDICGALRRYFEEWEMPDFPAEPKGFAIFAFQELRAARLAGVLYAERRVPWDRVVSSDEIITGFASGLKDDYPLLAQVLTNEQLNVVSLAWAALCWRLEIDREMRQELSFLDPDALDSGADTSLINLVSALCNWPDTIEELIGDVYADSTLRQRHRVEEARERIHRPLAPEEDAQLEREARAEVQAMLGQSVPIQATTLADAFVEAERLRESRNVLVAQNSLWAWFCALPPDQQALIGTFEGKYAKVRLYSAVRVKLSRG